jgi:hypothetical protein
MENNLEAVCMRYIPKNLVFPENNACPISPHFFKVLLLLLR